MSTSSSIQPTHHSTPEELRVLCICNDFCIILTDYQDVMLTIPPQYLSSTSTVLCVLDPLFEMSFVPLLLELYDDVALLCKGSDVSVAHKQMTEKRGQKLD